MLVEDDKSLREIYGVRLLAEGYDIVSAGDGEEALAMAIKERPKLIISDVMMPKISGFDMLDILRSTTETRDIKVIMMTALSSDDQRARGEQMGADRYLVKSQVGIEDVVRVVHEVLGDGAKPSAPPQAPIAPPRPTIAVQPPVPQSRPQAAPPAAPQQPQSQPQPQQPQRAPVPPASATTAPQQPMHQQPHQMPPISSSNATPPSAKQRIIQPIGDPATKVDINELLDRELARESGATGTPAPQVPTTAQERTTVQNQIDAFDPSPPPNVPHATISPDGHMEQTDRPVQVPQRPPQPPTPPSNPNQPQSSN